MSDSPTAKRGAPNIGRLLRARRRDLDMTLDEVASAADLTKSFLSDIERDKTSPSVASLVRLCEVLALPVGDLFTPARSGVVRSDDRPPIRFGGTGVSDYLISPAEAKRLQVIYSDIAPGGTGGEKLYTLGCEEEFVFVLDGAIRIVVEDTTHELGVGDAIAFDPRRPHTFANASASEPARALFVLTPPPR
ncbi:helix-turn-helix domain-containing protein [Mesorhizobium sp.]|uniref:helix-turn-helix domain-containing protein n=1 Tax=Mesorhizobium sp. TaxID=1871066 RepID=UPI0025DD7B13|nr:XRE family transcriptional regulator [Mesorhizobium sp.]